MIIVLLIRFTHNNHFTGFFTYSSFCHFCPLPGISFFLLFLANVILPWFKGLSQILFFHGSHLAYLQPTNIFSSLNSHSIYIVFMPLLNNFYLSFIIWISGSSTVNFWGQRFSVLCFGAWRINLTIQWMLHNFFEISWPA